MALAAAEPKIAQGLIEKAMVELVIQSEPKSGAEALRELRTAFPDSPLALRVAALNLLPQAGLRQTNRHQDNRHQDNAARHIPK